MMKFSALSAGIIALMVCAGIANANGVGEPRLLRLLDRIGMDQASEYFPDIVYLSTAGNNCRSYFQSPRVSVIPASLEEQVDVTLCTLTESMEAAAVDFDEIVEARLTARNHQVANRARAIIADHIYFGDLRWSVVISDQLPIENLRVLVAMELVAISPDSDEALVALDEPRVIRQP